jgi:LuxR family quorum sensing-dependent transcriptional regulator
MDHTAVICEIETCNSIESLSATLHCVVQDMGFAAFGFVDAGRIGRGEKPFYIGTGGPKWEQEYVRNGFAAVDPCLKRARRTNTPFTWRSTRLPTPNGRRAPGALKTMWAAWDHGFRDGLVVPFHFRDAEGFFHSSSAVFFWKDPLDRFDLLLRERQHELHIIMLYWIQRALDIIARDQRMTHSPFKAVQVGSEVVLTDRERDVLGWAAEGLTVAETAEKLHLSDDTIETHVRNAIRKLGANNKTHATALALHLGLIEI